MSDTVQEKRPKAVSMLTVHAGRGSGELENCLCVVSGHNASRQLPSPPPLSVFLKQVEKVHLWG